MGVFWKNHAQTFLIIAAVLILFGLGIYKINSALKIPDTNRKVLWGATFSERFSKELGLDWKENYSALLDDLKIRHFRLVAYWDLIEPQKGQFDWADLDYQMNLAAEHGAGVILAVGVKVPRWPECYYPQWTLNLNQDARRAEIKNFLTAVVERYKTNPAIKYWQVENEPYLPFGNCAKSDEPSYLSEEIKTVKVLDGAHPILTTGSAIVDPWYPEAKQGDIFGTSVYRKIYSDQFGHVNYPFSPVFYRAKEKAVRSLLNDYQKPFIVIELQGEPWIEGSLKESNTTEELANFGGSTFKDMKEYALQTNFNEFYWWGSEWWYFMKAQKGHPELWDYARSIFASSN